MPVVSIVLRGISERGFFMPSNGFRHHAAILFALLLAGCASNAVQPTVEALQEDGRYDNNSYMVDSSKMKLSRIASSVVELITRATFVTPAGTRMQYELKGSGVVVGRFILTVEHVVTLHGIKIQTPTGVLEPPVKKVEEVTYLRWGGGEHDLKVMYRNKDDDIALFELPLGVSPPSYPYEVGDSDDLRVGNYIYVVGNPMNLGINVREGIVSALIAPDQISRIDAKGKNAFMVSNGLVPGDSGTPVIAIRDGRFELVGLSQGTFVGNTRLGWVIRINAIRGLLSAANAIPDEGWMGSRVTLPVSAIVKRDEPYDFLDMGRQGGY